MAFANTGLPLIAINLPSTLFALIPIVLIEGFILSRQIGMPLTESIKSITKANLISTLLGFPLVWFFVHLLQLVLFKGSFFEVNTKTSLGKNLTAVSEFSWIFPYSWLAPIHVAIASTVMYLPFFLTSWWIESKVIQKQHQELPARHISKAVLHGNIGSYLLLIPFTIFLVFQKPHSDFLSKITLIFYRLTLAPGQIIKSIMELFT
jgi:hypothetical protein